MGDQYYIIKENTSLNQRGTLVKVEGGKRTIEVLCGDLPISDNILCVDNENFLTVSQGYLLKSVSKKQSENTIEIYQIAQKLEFLSLIAQCGAVGLGGGMQNKL